MRLTPKLVSLGLLLAVTGFASAKPAYVTSTVNLRAAPGTTSEVLTKIPGGSQVDAGECSEGWCAVTYQGMSGFAIETVLDLSGQPPVQRSARTRVYTNDPGYIEGPDVYYAPPPGVYYAPPPYYYGGYGYYGPYYRRHWGWRRW